MGQTGKVRGARSERIKASPAEACQAAGKALQAPRRRKPLGLGPRTGSRASQRLEPSTGSSPSRSAQKHGAEPSISDRYAAN